MHVFVVHGVFLYCFCMIDGMGVWVKVSLVGLNFGFVLLGFYIVFICGCYGDG